MTWGVMIVADDGTPYITEESTPISLQGIYSSSGDNRAIITTSINTEDVVLPFCFSTAEAYFQYSISAGQITVTATQTVGNNNPFTATLYLFTTRAQIPPAWGVAIWDKAGKCILTNETKVLTDVRNIGEKGGAESGLTINRNQPGKWAIVPEVAGYLIGVINTGGGPRPIQLQYAFTALFNGSSTIIKPVVNELAPSGIQNPSYINSMCAVKAIDVSRYD